MCMFSLLLSSSLSSNLKRKERLEKGNVETGASSVTGALRTNLCAQGHGLSHNECLETAPKAITL